MKVYDDLIPRGKVARRVLMFLIVAVCGAIIGSQLRSIVELITPVAVYEKTNGWKLKYFTLNILLPDSRVPELNQLVTASVSTK